MLLRTSLFVLAVSAMVGSIGAVSALNQGPVPAPDAVADMSLAATG